MQFSELISLAEKAALSFEYHVPEGKNKETISFNNAWADSRQIQGNDLFVCLKGDNSDGHAYIEKAIELGISVLIAEKSKVENPKMLPIACLLVENSMQALTQIAHTRRMQTNAKVIGITGTAGKTTIKELLAQMLSTKGKVAKNYMNYNTQIGLPLSILNADGNEDFWVLEAGISHEHDMDELAPLLRPDIALVLNAGLGHAEGLPQGAAYYKAKLFAHLKDEHSKALTSADYPALVKEGRKNNPQTLYFSAEGKEITYRASYIGLEEGEELKGKYAIYCDGNEYEVLAPFHGQHMAENAIALATLACLCGLNSSEIIKAFEIAKLPKQRFEVQHYNNKAITLIDDSYNANPLSFNRMIESAKEYTNVYLKELATKPFVCVIGAMGELGYEAEKAHEELGEFLADKARYVFYTGAFCEEVEKAYKKDAILGTFSALTSPENFAQSLKDLDLKEAVFLVKGSRSNHLEYYVQEIKKYYGDTHAI